MSIILGMDDAYKAAVESRGRNILISANLVTEMIETIRALELDLGLVTVALENKSGLLSSCETALIERDLLDK